MQGRVSSPRVQVRSCLTAFSAELAKAKKENAAQLAIIKRQDLRLKNPLRQMKFRDSEVTTDTDNSSGQQGQKRKRTKDDNEQYRSVGGEQV